MNGNGTNGQPISTLQSYHYPKPPMPTDQKKKLLEMHRASRANAGIYVAVVLAVYVVLLTILLCRYARQRRFSFDDIAGDDDGQPHGFLGLVIRKLRRLKALLCVCCRDGNSSGSVNSGATNGEYADDQGGQGNVELTQGLTAHV